MKLEKASKKELIALFEKILANSNEPCFIVNSIYKVVHTNSSFNNFCQKNDLEIEFFDFGNALGCKYLTKDNHACGNNYYCELCSVRNAINSCISKGGNYSSGDFVRDFEIADETIFRHIIFKAFYFEIEKAPHVAIIINNSETDILGSEIE
jgi:hypothetical protein